MWIFECVKHIQSIAKIQTEVDTWHHHHHHQRAQRIRKVIANIPSGKCKYNLFTSFICGRFHCRHRIHCHFFAQHFDFHSNYITSTPPQNYSRRKRMKYTGYVKSKRTRLLSIFVLSLFGYTALIPNRFDCLTSYRKCNERKKWERKLFHSNRDNECQSRKSQEKQ